MKGYEALAWYLKAAGINFCVVARREGLEHLVNAFSERGIDVVIPVSETASAMIADGYSRASGKPALVIGRGEMLKLVTGTASAWSDKTPLIVLSIDPEPRTRILPDVDRNSIDISRVFKTVTRFHTRAGTLDDIPEVLVQGFQGAVSLRGGPVLVEIPESVLEEEGKVSEERFGAVEERLRKAQVPVRMSGDPGRVHKALEMLAAARRPLIFSGGGVIRSGACAEINQLALRLQIPILSSMGGMGSVYPENPMYVGPSSYLTGEAFHTAIKKADVVLAAGCVFSGLDGFGLPPIWSRAIRFIHINIDPEHIAFNPSIELALLGDAKLIISDMIEGSQDRPAPPGRKTWLEKLRRLAQEHRQRVVSESCRPWKRIHPASLVLELKRLFMGDQDVRVVLDGGNACLWSGMLTDLPGPRRGFFPTGMGTLGSGLPMAIGVKKAVGDARVVLLSGDGSFLYNLQEFETLRRYRLPVLVVVFNDCAWNMIRAGQVSFTGNVFGTDLPETDYGRVAESYGCFGAKVKTAGEIESVVKDALSSGRPAVIDVAVDPDSIPDSLISFARVEFEGARLSMKGMFRSLLSGTQKLDIRLVNQIRYILRSF